MRRFQNFGKAAHFRAQRTITLGRADEDGRRGRSSHHHPTEAPDVCLNLGVMPPKAPTSYTPGDDVSKLTVKVLKEELEKRSLPSDGLKAALVKRLQEAVDGGGDAAAAAPEPAAEAAVRPPPR